MRSKALTPRDEGIMAVIVIVCSAFLGSFVGSALGALFAMISAG